RRIAHVARHHIEKLRRYPIRELLKRPHTTEVVRNPLAKLNIHGATSSIFWRTAAATSVTDCPPSGSNEMRSQSEVSNGPSQIASRLSDHPISIMPTTSPS